MLKDKDALLAEVELSGLSGRRKIIVRSTIEKFMSRDVDHAVGEGRSALKPADDTALANSAAPDRPQGATVKNVIGSLLVADPDDVASATAFAARYRKQVRRDADVIVEAVNEQGAPDVPCGELPTLDDPAAVSIDDDQGIAVVPVAARFGTRDRRARLEE